MLSRAFGLFCIAFLCVTFVGAAPVAAHIGMEYPTPRFDDGANKWCPCGTGGDGSSSNDGCERDGSDPNRGLTSTTFAPGETVRVLWQETIGHSGRMRVAFDDDGADQADFDAQILGDLSDPGGNTGNLGDGNNWGMDVTLPMEPCDNCTLQLVQVMNGITGTPVTSLTGTATYFQCANIVIAAAAEGEGEGEGEDEAMGCQGCSSTAPELGLFALVLFGLPLCRRKLTRSGRRLR